MVKGETDSLSSDFHTYATTPLSSVLNFFVLKEQKRIYLGRQLGPLFWVSSATFEELSHKDRTVGKELVRKPARVSSAHPAVGNVIVLSVRVPWQPHASLQQGSLDRPRSQACPWGLCPDKASWAETCPGTKQKPCCHVRSCYGGFEWCVHFL